MALVLGVKKDSVFYVDDQPVRTLDTHGHDSVTLEVGDKQFKITDKEATEIVRDVFVSMGLPENKKDGLLSRVVIEAPREITILREELYDRNRGQK